MSMNRRYVCDACGESFWQTVESKKAPPPPGCPNCNGTGDLTAEALVWKSAEKRQANAAIQKMVAEGKGPGYNANARTQLRSEEQVFRAMEAGSIQRAEMAAADLGVPVAEMSNLKITNMRDNPKPGETSAVIPMSQPALQMRDQARQMSFNPSSQPIPPSAFAGQGTVINGKQVGTLVGPAADYHGARTFLGLTSEHGSRAASVAARGQLNK
jgi:DNA-directed RNA polymerase subunit RPC12/RpoP